MRVFQFEFVTRYAPDGAYASWLRLSGFARYASAMRLFALQIRRISSADMHTPQNVQSTGAALHHAYSYDKLNRCEAVKPIMCIELLRLSPDWPLNGYFD